MEVPRENTRERKRWKPWQKGLLIAGKLTVLTALLLYIFRGIDLQLIKRSFLRIPLYTFIAAMGIQLLIQLVQALRWRLLSLGGRVAYGEYFVFTCIGNAMNLISPGALFSDTLNAYFLGKRNEILSQSITSILVGRLLGVSALIAFAGVFFLPNLPYLANLSLPTPNFSRGIWAGLVLLGAALGIAILLKRRLGRSLAHLRILLRRPRVLASALGLSFLIQFGTMSIGYIGYVAMNVPISVGNILFFGSFITILGLLPVSFGQIGVREGLNIFFFTLIPGVEKEHILANAAYGYTIAVSMSIFNILVAWKLMGMIDKDKQDNAAPQVEGG